MRTMLAALLVTLPLAAADPGMEGLREILAGYKRNLVEAVQKTPEGYLDFRPTAEVNSYREMVGHIVDAQYAICATAKQEKNPQPERIVKKVLSKADLVSAVQSSFGYCDDVLAGLDSTKLAQKVKTGSSEYTISYHAVHSVEHTALHYGNLITYMRLRGVVPPETERRNLPAAEPAKVEMLTYYMGFLKKGSNGPPRSHRKPPRSRKATWPTSRNQPTPVNSSWPAPSATTAISAASSSTKQPQSTKPAPSPSKTPPSKPVAL